MPDHRDLDSDGDGCFDVAEAGFSDADNDGALDGTGVSTTGLVTGNTDGYTGTNAQVVQSTVFGCEESVLFYQVNIDSDLTDANPGDGICADINGNCSLRAAIEEANSGSSLTEIGFLINGTIQLDSPLPTILKKMSINGTSAPGYAIGAPSIVISNPGNTIFNLSEADGTIIQGIDLSGAAGNFDVYGIVLAWCDDVVIKDNIIRNRTRAIHANNCCGLTVSRNDLRDAGRNSWDAAAYFINVCPGASETELYVAENQFGELNLNPQCAVQVLNASDIITSDGTVSGSNIVLNQALETSFPMRYVNVNGGSISNIDLSNQGAQEGIGLTLLNCSSIDVENVDIKNRHMGAHIIGGVGHSVKNCDFTDSGLNDDYAVVRLENISASSQADFAMEGNTMNDDVFTMFNFINCSGLSISTDAGVSPNILMGAQVIESHTAFRLQSSSSMSISGFDFKRDDQLIGTEGIIAELGSTSLTVSDCSFEGFASGINLADCSAADISCNTMVWNRNGIWVFGTSTVSALYQNSYHCNQVGIHNHTSTLVSSPNDYWGDPTGSQTDSGLGDHYEGLLDVSTWLAAPPACAGPVNSNVCSPEDCDNGIDDDGDGLTDCEDRACNNHVGCDDNKSLTNDITGTPVSIINSIYPNPTDESSNIELNLDCDQLSIRDLSGRIVYHTENQKSGLLLVDVSAFNAGMYIIVATSGSQSEAHTIVVD
jgi:CSLREA domain-containing protein